MTLFRRANISICGRGPALSAGIAKADAATPAVGCRCA